MKKLILTLICVPYFSFACQDCIDQIRDKIDDISHELIILISQNKQHTVKYHILYGKYDAYHDTLKILQKHIKE